MPPRPHVLARAATGSADRPGATLGSPPCGRSARSAPPPHALRPTGRTAARMASASVARLWSIFASNSTRTRRIGLPSACNSCSSAGIASGCSQSGRSLVSSARQSVRVRARIEAAPGNGGLQMDAQLARQPLAGFRQAPCRVGSPIPCAAAGRQGRAAGRRGGLDRDRSGRGPPGLRRRHQADRTAGHSVQPRPPERTTVACATPRRPVCRCV